MIQLMNQPTYLIDGKILISKVEMEEKKGQIDSVLHPKSETK